MIDRLRAVKLPSVRQRWMILAGGTLWVLLLLAGAVPTWNRVHHNVEELELANARLASLSDWSVAGAWLGEAALRWEPLLEARYSHLFPVVKEREDLFLDLTEIARESGVEPLLVQEMAPSELTTGLEDEDLPAIDPVVEDLLERFAPDRSDLPTSELESYRLHASFETDYVRLARFLEGLAGIERALSIEWLRAEPVRGVVAVEMELDVYVQRID